MRDFTCSNKEVLRFEIKSVISEEPAFAQPAFAECLYEPMVDGSIMYHDMFSVIRDVEKYAEKVGPSVVQDLMYQLQPQPLQAMDKMTDEQRFGCVVSRYCQTISERTSLLEYLSANHSELLSQLSIGEDGLAQGDSPSATSSSDNG